MKLDTRRFYSESGAIALLPMIMVLAFSAMVVFGYLSVSQNVLGRMNSKREGEQAIDNVMNRVSSLMAIRDGSSCDTGVMNAILKVRDLSNPTSVAFVKSFSTTGASLKTINCVLLSDEATKLVSLQIKFFSLNTDQDLAQLSRTIKITVSGQSTRFANNISVERLMRIRVANLAQNAIVFWGSNTKNKIQIDSGAALTVSGSTLVAVDDPNTPFTFQGFVTGLSLPYNGQIIFKKGVYTNSIYATTGADALLQKSIASVFTEGLQTNFLPGVPLPLFSSSDPAYAGVDSVWQNDIDYEYVYGSSMAPLPQYPGATSMVDSAHLYTNKGAKPKIPDASTTQNVSDTCRGRDDNQGSIRAMVLLQQSHTVTIDFTSSSEPTAGTDAFCGLVMAKTLIVKLRGDANLFGHFFVGKLKVEGTGTLQIVDPESASDIILPPVGHGFDLLRRQLLALQIFIGQAFYVPLSYNPSFAFSSYPQFIPQPIYKQLKPDSPGANPTWPTSLDSSVRTTDPKAASPASSLFSSGAGTNNLVFTPEVIL